MRPPALPLVAALLLLAAALTSAPSGGASPGAASPGAELLRVWDSALPAVLLQHAASEVDFIFAPGPHAADDRARSLWVPLRQAKPSDTQPPFALSRVVARLHRLAFVR